MLQLIDEFYYKIYKEIELHNNYIGEDISVYVLNKENNTVCKKIIYTKIKNQKIDTPPSYWKNQYDKDEIWFNEQFPWE